MCGIPFSSPKEPKIYLKKDSLDKARGSLRGQAWYDQQAFRAVNQAIGRVIRHRKGIIQARTTKLEDYGAIILMDQRFDRPAYRQKLPKWISRRISDGKVYVLRLTNF
jgi:hypothetical protein